MNKFMKEYYLKSDIINKLIKKIAKSFLMSLLFLTIIIVIILILNIEIADIYFFAILICSTLFFCTFSLIEVIKENNN